MSLTLPQARRLLTFDDDPMVGVTISAIAKTVDFETRAATDGDDFFRIVKEWEPTHIALDLVMPNIDGIEVMRLLGKLPCTAAIIITSGVGGRVLDAAQRAASEYGLYVAGAISKPFGPPALRALLTKERVPTTPSTPASPSVAPVRSGDIDEEELALALDQHEFVIFYQPKIACGTGQLAGVEGLVRWNSKQRGMTAPDEFIPLAERTGLIDPLTDQIIEQALSWFSESVGVSEMLLSLNISAYSLHDVDMARRIANCCHRHATNPSSVILEVTETSAITDKVLSLDLLTRFRLMGFRLSIDDFGVGHSSLVQLARLPFSELKIDKSFVMSSQKSEESRNIVIAVIALAHSMGLSVTAEGVEDEWTLRFLTESNCDFAQGYFIGHPMSGSAIPSWVRSRS